MEGEAKNYEFAYLLSSSVPEDDVLLLLNKISALIEGAHGVLRHSEPPKKRQLAYQVQKEISAYFGWMSLSAPPESIIHIKNALKGFQNLLRYLIVQREDINIKPRAYPARILYKPQPQEVQKPHEKKDEALDLEALDKKLEEILGK